MVLRMSGTPSPQGLRYGPNAGGTGVSRVAHRRPPPPSKPYRMTRPSASPSALRAKASSPQPTGARASSSPQTSPAFLRSDGDYPVFVTLEAPGEPHDQQQGLLLGPSHAENLRKWKAPDALPDEVHVMFKDGDICPVQANQLRPTTMILNDAYRNGHSRQHHNYQPPPSHTEDGVRKDRSWTWKHNGLGSDGSLMKLAAKRGDSEQGWSSFWQAMDMSSHRSTSSTGSRPRRGSFSSF